MRQKGPVEEVELAGDEEQHNAPFSLARFYPYSAGWLLRQKVSPSLSTYDDAWQFAVA